MINYGLDEGQEEAIKWTINELDQRIGRLETLISMDMHRINSGLLNYRKDELQQGIEVKEEKLKLLRKHRSSLVGMLGVTDK